MAAIYNPYEKAAFIAKRGSMIHARSERGSPKTVSGLILLGISASLFAIGGCNNQRAAATQQQEARTEVPPRSVPPTRPPQPATVQTPVDTLYQQAQGLSHSDIHKAMDLLEAAIAKAPDSPNSAPYYLLLGRLKKEFENCQLHQSNSPLDNPKKQCEDFTEYAKARPTEYFYNEVGGDYLYHGVHFQELEKRFPSSALAVEAAYEITNLSKGGECEGFLDCYIESAFSPVRDFLLRYPDSPHTKEAIKRADDAFRKTLWGDVWKTESAEIKDPNQASDSYDPTNLKKMVQEYEDLAEKLPLRFRARPWETVAYYRNRFGEKDRARELYEKIVRQFPDYENIGEVRQNLATLK
jgi:outer membrane protein assembly factor BamD (BamD/ComL family)